MCSISAIAEVHKNGGNDEFNKKEYRNAINSYTKGINVNCKDEQLNAKLYSNRATAHFRLGKTLCHLNFYTRHMPSKLATVHIKARAIKLLTTGESKNFSERLKQR